MSTDKSNLLKAADVSSKSSICNTCSNYYMDDCGYCCKREGDEFMPAEDWENDAVTDCKYYEADDIVEERKSIKEYNTSGMELYEREDLYKKVIPIPVDELVYRSGDAWSGTECVKVTLENQKEVTMFWNSLYFDNKEAADRVTSMAHADYNDYQGRAVYYDGG